MPPAMEATAPAAPLAPAVKPVLEPPVPVVAPPPALEKKTYTVQSGDSLSYIAQRFNVGVKDIAKMNSLANPNKLRAGQKLELPGYVNLDAPKPPRKHKPAAPQPAAAPAVPGGGEYVVKSGDCVSKIASAHGTTTKALMEVNNLQSDKLKVGQKLALPQGAGGMAVVEVPGAAGIEPAGEAGVPGAVPPPAEGATFTHVIEANQDLGEVAMIYSVSVDDLVKMNGLTNTTVKVGQVLKIPAAGQ
jgi:LysM repeat protein